jgi:toxin CptA
MHSAPAVSYPVGRSRLGGVLLFAAWALGAVAVATWCMQVQPSAARVLSALALVLASGAAAGWSWVRTPRGALAWDGESWGWSGEGKVDGSGALEVVLDLQRLLLVRWRGPDRAGWLWLDKSARPERWEDVRRAVYSRARPPAPPGAQAPEAKP